MLAAILPAHYFTGATVTKGGQGAGTEITFTMNVYGNKATYQMKVSEPEPGRVLQEEDAAAGVLATFTVDALNDTKARVTIATTARSSSGLKGRLEKMTTLGAMRCSSRPPRRAIWWDGMKSVILLVIQVRTDQFAAAATQTLMLSFSAEGKHRR